jgi:heme/copper-type cytochrome/quinol oxidase subunit 2
VKLSRAKGIRLAVIAAALALAALAAAWPESALAQCPLCRTAAQQAGDQTARTLNLAIVVLLIPPVSIFCAIFAVVYRRAKGDEEQNRGR